MTADSGPVPATDSRPATTADLPAAPASDAQPRRRLTLRDAVPPASPQARGAAREGSSGRDQRPAAPHGRAGDPLSSGGARRIADTAAAAVAAAARNAPAPAPATKVGEPDVIASATLLKGRDAVLIEHNGRVYELRKTRQGKLILTK